MAKRHTSIPSLAYIFTTRKENKMKKFTIFMFLLAFYIGAKTIVVAQDVAANLEKRGELVNSLTIKK